MGIVLAAPFFFFAIRSPLYGQAYACSIYSSRDIPRYATTDENAPYELERPEPQPCLDVFRVMIFDILFG